MPFGGPPAMEMPLGEIDTAALAPTLMVMQNLPSIASLASSMVAFVIDTEREPEVLEWMSRQMCEKHAQEVELRDIPQILRKYKAVLDDYLHSLGMEQDDGCSHEKD